MTLQTLVKHESYFGAGNALCAPYPRRSAAIGPGIEGSFGPDLARRGGSNRQVPAYAAFLAYGYGQATEDEATKLRRVLELAEEAQRVLQKVPHRSPPAPWPPTDPFIYRLYEVVMLYGPVFKDIAHELFGDGIMSAIDMSVDIEKKEDPVGVPRMKLTLNGEWPQYKKF